MNWQRRQAEQRKKQMAKNVSPLSKIKRPQKKTKADTAKADKDTRSAMEKAFQGMANDFYSQSQMNSLSYQQQRAQLMATQQLATLGQRKLNNMATASSNPGNNIFWQQANGFMTIGNPYGAPPSGPAGDPKFKEKDRVLVGSGKVVHVVKNSQWDGYRYVYSVVSTEAASGVSRKEYEDSLKLAPKEKAKVSFDTVILEDAKKQAIIDTMQGVENHELIFTHWGFEEVMEKGKATSFLFYGVPGTGKTLMAQAIADKLGKDLLIIGSAEIESSEPGGAERAIKAFFQTKDKVLLFDECDSLVYERSAVGSILGAQVNALLTSLENYDGTVIFTTNRLGVLDEAFNRRLSLKVEFEMPSLEHRIKIWQRMFPKKAPLDKDIDWTRLASVEVTGGYIKNAVLRSARIAANRKHTSISEDVIVEALKDEIQSMIDFEEAKKQVYHVPRQGGPTVGMSRAKDITKSIGGQ